MQIASLHSGEQETTFLANCQRDFHSATVNMLQVFYVEFGVRKQSGFKLVNVVQIGFVSCGDIG